MDLLVAHSLNEAYLYLMVTYCSACGEGPLIGGGGRVVETDETRQRDKTTAIDVTCKSCTADHTYTFIIPEDLARLDPDRPNRINPTVEPSKIVDVAQWITLYRILCEAADKERNRSKARIIRIEAGFCLEESLKFYGEESELPPDAAFFHDSSRERLKKNPETFSRSRLIHLLASLPVPLSESSSNDDSTKRG